MNMVEDVKHERIKTNGIWMHIAHKGTGPLVLLLHGFPETWYTWHHQMNFLATHGYHVIAPDLRGFGDSDSPLESTAYTAFHLVGDIIGLIDHLGAGKAFVVGSDWGSVVAWHLGLFRPDRVKGLVCLAAPFSPRSLDIKPVALMKQMFGDDLYICQFQERGRAERAFARHDYMTVMKKFFLINKTLPVTPPGVEFIDWLDTPATLPSWITEEELQVFADKFQETGFTGGLNYYRAMDLNWEVMGPWQGSQITVPVKFMVGDKDIGFDAAGTREYIQGNVFKTLVPNLQVVILDGHHYIHKERAHEVSEEILSFFSEFLST